MPLHMTTPSRQIRQLSQPVRPQMDVTVTVTYVNGRNVPVLRGNNVLLHITKKSKGQIRQKKCHGRPPTSPELPYVFHCSETITFYGSLWHSLVFLYFTPRIPHDEHVTTSARPATSASAVPARPQTRVTLTATVGCRRHRTAVCGRCFQQ